MRFWSFDISEFRNLDLPGLKIAKYVMFRFRALRTKYLKFMVFTVWINEFNDFKRTIVIVSFKNLRQFLNNFLLHLTSMGWNLELDDQGSHPVSSTQSTVSTVHWFTDYVNLGKSVFLILIFITCKIILNSLVMNTQ